MGSVNKVIILGNVGRDPELKYTPSGTAVTNFTVATNERWKDREGSQQEHTEWHRIVAWGKLAEICGEYLSKGRQVYIEGAIRSRTYKDRDGNDRTAFDIRADNVVLLGSGGGGSKSSEASRASDDQEPEYSDDDIPF